MSKGDIPRKKYELGTKIAEFLDRFEKGRRTPVIADYVNEHVQRVNAVCSNDPRIKHEFNKSYTTVENWRDI